MYKHNQKIEKYVLHYVKFTNPLSLNPQTARILTSHKGLTWAREAQVLSHLYVGNNQFDVTYHVWFNKYKTKNDQYKIV